jgi:hypothetical protein
MNLATEAPTFYSLNKSQKRALLLRDQLRYTDAHHLDNFIEGVGDPEPPAFKRIQAQQWRYLSSARHGYAQG